MKPIIYSRLDFDTGMTPKPYTKNGIVRSEHFNTIDGTLRPYRTLVASQNNTGQANSVLALLKITSLNDTPYAVGTDAATPANGAIYAWDTTNFDWRGKLSFGAASVPNAQFIGHAGALFGLRNSRYIYKMTTAGVYTASFGDYGATYTNGFADPVVHSKDGRCYWPIDNKIYYIDSTGATFTLGLTLPNSNYLITSIAEEGNYLNIVGYDVKSGQSSSLIWDRDTSVVDLTESIALGPERVFHNATLLGTTFTVQLRADNSNSAFQERPVLVVKYLSGAIAKTILELPVATLNVANMGGKWVSNDRLYFAAQVALIGESSARNVVFVLNDKGELKIAQNAAVDTGTLAITGLFQEGEAFWLAAGSDGAWNTTTTYVTVAALETSIIRSDNFAENLDFMGAGITMEALPSGGQIVLKARKNEETTYTTLDTITTANTIKYSVIADVAKAALAGLADAKQVQFRLESTGGAVITGFEAAFSPVNTEAFAL